MKKSYLYILLIFLFISVSCQIDITNSKNDIVESQKDINDEDKKNNVIEESVDIKKNIISVSLGINHSLALMEDGTVWTWGSNENNTLGFEGIKDCLVPVRILDLKDIVKVSADGKSYALMSNGSLWMWPKGVNDVKPTVEKNYSNLVEIDGYSIALKREGTVLTRGSNLFGECGDGTKGILEDDGRGNYIYDEENKEKNNPVIAKNLTDVVDIAAGIQFHLALKNDGTVWAWGRNDITYLCVGSDEEAIIVPTKVLGLDNIIQISAGQEAFALRKDGTVWTWGDHDSPTQIVELKDIVKISCGYYHYLALDKNGVLWSWGDNRYGQLGNGSTSFSSIPDKIDLISDIIDISAGMYNSAAVTKNGRLWTWGNNDKGQLGIGNKESRNIPTEVIFTRP